MAKATMVSKESVISLALSEDEALTIAAILGPLVLPIGACDHIYGVLCDLGYAHNHPQYKEYEQRFIALDRIP